MKVRKKPVEVDAVQWTGENIYEIMDFMQWLHDNENNEEAPWVRTWTIWTVQKKIPEFLAGKLKTKSVEDEYPKYE